MESHIVKYLQMLFSGLFLREIDFQISQKECLNCGAQCHSKYCPECGQEMSENRLDVQTLGKHIRETIFPIDSKFFRSLCLLVFCPYKIIIDYINGARKKITHPFVIFVTLHALLFLIVPLAVHTIIFPNLILRYIIEAVLFPIWIVLGQDSDIYQYILRNGYLLFLLTIPYTSWALYKSIKIIVVRINYVETLYAFTYMICAILTIYVLCEAISKLWVLPDEFILFAQLFPLMIIEIYIFGKLKVDFAKMMLLLIKVSLKFYSYLLLPILIAIFILVLLIVFKGNPS